jgi:hypothetical protein
MIMVPGGADSVFESVYFVLRSDVKQESNGGDMVAEANRIVNELEDGEREGKRSAVGWKKSLLFFAAGAATGSGAAALLFFLC